MLYHGLQLPATAQFPQTETAMCFCEKIFQHNFNEEKATSMLQILGTLTSLVLEGD
jgi:hypothetical protein